MTEKTPWLVLRRDDDDEEEEEVKEEEEGRTKANTPKPFEVSKDRPAATATAAAKVLAVVPSPASDLLLFRRFLLSLSFAILLGMVALRHVGREALVDDKACSSIMLLRLLVLLLLLLRRLRLLLRPLLLLILPLLLMLLLPVAAGSRRCCCCLIPDVKSEPHAMVVRWRSRSIILRAPRKLAESVG